MSKIKLKFLKPGIQTLIQDPGRPGYQAFGVPQSGPLDRTAAMQANELLGNPAETPVLEITLIGPQIEISNTCHVAITGADLSPTIDGEKVAMYEPLTLKDGGTLTFGKTMGGCRAYLAIAGSWQVKKWLGSASAATHNAQVLTPDSVIEKNQTLIIEPTTPKPKSVNVKRPLLTNTLRVRVMAGPEFDAFSKKSIARFFSHGHAITADSNRMGYRLASTISDFKIDKELISSGTVPGTIQITNEGQPIILLADAQTTGGYYRIANIIDEDLDLIAQLKPGDEIWFSLIDTL